GADGVAAATSWTLGPTAGTNTLTATSGTLSGSPVTFTATGTAGAASQLVLTTPPSSTARSGVPLAQQPIVQLQDANGNLVNQAGVVVTATVSPTGATASNATATTAGHGAATFRGLTLSGAVGSYTLSFGGGTGPTAAGDHRGRRDRGGGGRDPWADGGNEYADGDVGGAGAQPGDVHGDGHGGRGKQTGAHGRAVEHGPERRAVGAAAGGAAAGRQRQPRESGRRARDSHAEPGGGGGERQYGQQGQERWGDGRAPEHERQSRD